MKLTDNEKRDAIAKEAPKGKHKVAVKVFDIFGNDTTKVIEAKI